MDKNVILSIVLSLIMVLNSSISLGIIGFKEPRIINNYISPMNINASINASFNGTSNYLAKFAGSYLLDNSALYQKSGKIGWGTTNPLANGIHIIATGSPGEFAAERSGGVWVDVLAGTSASIITWKPSTNFFFGVSPAGRNIGDAMIKSFYPLKVDSGDKVIIYEGTAGSGDAQLEVNTQATNVANLGINTITSQIANAFEVRMPNTSNNAGISKNGYGFFGTSSSPTINAKTSTLTAYTSSISNIGIRAYTNETNQAMVGLQLVQNPNTPINFQGMKLFEYLFKNSAGTYSIGADIRMIATDVSSSSGDGNLVTYILTNNVLTEYSRMTGGITTFNNGGVDIDTLIKSDNFNIFKVDAGTDTVRLGDGTTDYTNFNGNGTLTLIGDARVKREIRINIDGVSKGASAPTSALRDVGASGTVKKPVLQFSKTIQQDAYFEFHPSAEMDETEDVMFHQMWIPGASYTSGFYTWCLEYLIKYENATYGDANISVGTPTTICINQTPSSADNIIESHYPQTIGINYNQVLIGHFYRDVATDNADDIGSLNFFEFEFVKNKLGEEI